MTLGRTACRRMFGVLMFLSASASAPPAGADLITVDWKVLPAFVEEADGAPFYECRDAPGTYVDIRCEYLWQHGLELVGDSVLLFGDKWFDGFRAGGVPEAELSPLAGDAAMIRPRCEPAFAPCFDTFTPTRLEIYAITLEAPTTNLFITSSRGAIRKVPSVDGPVIINFGGDEWTAIEWMRIGFYFPRRCARDYPPWRIDCDPGGDRAHTIERLTFGRGAEGSVPEPAVSTLIGMAVAGLLVRTARRRRHAH